MTNAIGCFNSQLRLFTDLDSQTVRLQACGKLVCYIGFCAVYDVSFYRYYHARSMVLEGLEEVLHKNKYRFYEHPKHDSAVRWLKYRYYEVAFCETMPHLHITYLPSAIDKVDLWHMCIKFLQKNYTMEVIDCPAYTYFCSLMSTCFSHLRQPRTHQLGRCGRCVELDDAYAKCKNNPEREAVRALKTDHVKDFMAQRKHYDDIREHPPAYMTSEGYHWLNEDSLRVHFIIPLST